MVDTIAYSLKEGKTGDEYKVSELVKKTFMSHVTVSYYLELITHVQNNLPKIEYVEKKRNSFIKILKEVELPLSDEEHLLLSLFDKGAFTRSNAVPFFEGSINVLNKMKELSFLTVIAGKVFLLPEGIVKAAEIAERRADFVLSPQKQKVIEKGEIKFEEWARPPNVIVDEGSDAQESLLPVKDTYFYASPAA